MAEMTGQEIYDNFQNGRGPEGLAAGSAAARQLMQNYRARMFDIQQLAAEMESAWEGSASDGARRGAAPLIQEHGSASEHFSVAEDLTDRQSGSFSRAKNSVVPVPEVPQEVPPWGPMSSDWMPYLQQVKDHGEAARHNVEVMTDYSGASAYNTENLPTSYGEMAADRSGVSVGGGDTIDSESFREAGDSGDISGPPPGGGEPGPRGGSPVSGPPVGGPSGGPADGDGPGASSGSSTLPSEVTTPGGYTPVSGGFPSTSLPGTDGAGRPSSTGTPLVGFGGSGPGFGGGGSGNGSGGYPGGDGRGAAGGSRGVMSVPRGTGVGPGAVNESVATGSRAAGARGASGMHGMPMNNRGRDEDDVERRTPTYLEGGDPEDLFGSELLTAPPVIGEDDD